MPLHEKQMQILASPDWTVVLSLVWVTGTPVYSGANRFEILGNPVKTRLKVTGTPVKTCLEFWQS